MRIVGGEHRGRKLVSPEGVSTRPTSDRVREAVFNILRGDILDAVVFDAFSGSGAMALEAISRGAKRAYACESDKSAQQTLRKNIALCRAEHVVTFFPSPWQAAISKMREVIDIVFCDPPYAMHEAYGDVLSALEKARLLRENSIAVLEYPSADPQPRVPGGWEIFDIRKYGASSVAFARQTGCGA
ncbi:MAG: 16S rRNA (guanine(966)-N(2))-methyltransferase RsmD [Christensenellales bacterium]|jgi:16S rRNA (guanine966-N2)-methyltransferase